MKVTEACLERGKRVAAWCCIGAIGMLSLLPGVEVAPMRTSLGGHVEHLLTYAATSLVIAFAYLDDSRIKIAACLVLYAAILEFLQRYSPGRVSSLEDLAFSTGGIILGLAAFQVLEHLRARQGLRRRSLNEDVNARS